MQEHVSRLKTGDTASFELLYNQWSGKLYNFVMRLSKGDEYLAEEIVQSVFVKIWEKREELDPNKSFAAFICTIAKNQLTNIYQHRMLEILYQKNVLQKVSPSENTTEKEVEYRLLDEYVNTLINQLPAARREIYILSRRKFLSNKEIAERLNISENTVESQLTKAMSFLRIMITQHYNWTLSLLIYSLFD